MEKMHEFEFLDWFTKTKKSGFPNTIWSEEKRALYVSWLAGRLQEEEYDKVAEEFRERALLRAESHRKLIGDQKKQAETAKAVKATLGGNRRRHYKKTGKSTGKVFA